MLLFLGAKLGKIFGITKLFPNFFYLWLRIPNQCLGR